MREPPPLEPLLERMAKAGYEEIAKRKEAIIGSEVPAWEDQTEELREEYLALARAIQQSLGGPKGRRRLGIPFIVCAIVLAFLGGFATSFWTAEWAGFPRQAELGRGSTAISQPAPVEPNAQAPSTEAPTASGAGPDVNAPATDATAQEPSAPPPPPSPTDTGNSDRATPTAERQEPQITACPVALEPWPADGTRQGKAIQILLRDLGFYSGPTSGTVGPLTRAAIRKFELASNQAATGEPSKILFELLKKKKCGSIAP